MAQAPDTVTINNIQDFTKDGYVKADCTVTVNGTGYAQQFTVSQTDNASIVAAVRDQSQNFRQKVIDSANLITAATATSTDVTKLDGTVIDL